MGKNERKAYLEAIRGRYRRASRPDKTRILDEFCAVCGGAARTRFERGGLRYWQCGRCGRQCSLISGTIFEASKLPLTRWFLAMQLLTQAKNNVSALELMRQLGVSYRSAWLIKHKIMEAMRLREGRRELDGRVEMDDAYLGGERSGGKRDLDDRVRPARRRADIAASRAQRKRLPKPACRRPVLRHESG